MIVKMPDAFRANRLPIFPAGGDVDPDCLKKFKALDGKCRMHNMARRIAAMPSKDARNDYMAGLKHAPPVIEKFKQLVRYYWRQQRKKQAAQTK